MTCWYYKIINTGWYHYHDAQSYTNGREKFAQEALKVFFFGLSHGGILKGLRSVKSSNITQDIHWLHKTSTTIIEHPPLLYLRSPFIRMSCRVSLIQSTIVCSLQIRFHLLVWWDKPKEKYLEHRRVPLYFIALVLLPALKQLISRSVLSSDDSSLKTEWHVQITDS